MTFNILERSLGSSQGQIGGNTCISDPAKPPFRADHVGSLLRPQRLHDAREKKANGEITDVDLRAVEDDCIREAIKGQEKVGIKAITDGEFRRSAWHYDFLCSLEGIDESAPHQGPTFQAGQSINSLEVKSKIKNPKGVMIDHFRFLKENTKETPKFCIPSPSLAYHRGGRNLIDQTIYPDLEEFWEDLCAAYQNELQFLYDEGCRYLQLDDTTFAMLCDPKVRAQMADRGDDPVELIRTYARGIAKALEQRPDDMIVSVHMCRGNYKSSWIAEGGYDVVAEDMFAGTIGWILWSTTQIGLATLNPFAMRNAIVVGLVSSKLAEIEQKDDLKEELMKPPNLYLLKICA